MSVWLMKTEPDEFSISDLAKRGQENWEGVRNFQARNFMLTIKVGDLVLIYHSSCKQVGITGLAEVIAEAHPDLSSLDPDSSYFDAKSTPENPRWVQVTLGFKQAFDRVITLAELKTAPEMANSPLVKKGSRLSVMPIEESEWTFIQSLI